MAIDLQPPTLSQTNLPKEKRNTQHKHQLNLQEYEQFPLKHKRYKTHACSNKRLPELLGQNAAIVRDIDGLKNAVKLQFLVVHVLPELLEIHSPILVGIAGVQQILRVLILSRNLERRETGLNVRVVQEPEILSVEEIEEAPNPSLTCLLRLLRRQQHVIHRHTRRYLLHSH